VDDLRRFVDAEDIRPGALVRTPDGALLTVVGVRTWRQVQRVHT
jgi:hypothetical protein